MTAPAASSPVAPRGVALFGGTFNPPHKTHVRIMETAAAKLLDVGLFIVLPSGNHPHKNRDERALEVADATHRMQMAKLAFASLEHLAIQVDPFEIKQQGLSFSVETAQVFRDALPDEANLYWLLGADNVVTLPSWREHHRFLSLVTVVTFPREGFTVDAPTLAALDLTASEQATILDHVLEVPADDVSATAIRGQLRAGQRGIDALDPRVEEYAMTHDLWGIDPPRML